jgi:GPN-loop GTPase
VNVERVKVFVIGPAGSGKSRLVGAFAEWMEERDYTAMTVNLDPGADELPYTPDVDVREWVRLGDLMAEQGLGPNGAQVAAADMVALRSQELADLIAERPCHYVLIDTPGQTELFLFRNASRVIIDALGAEESIAVALVDPFMAARPSSFVSHVLLNAIIQFRLRLPVINAVGKADLVDPGVLANVLLWTQDFPALYGALMDEDSTVLTQLSIDMLRVMEEAGTYRAAMPVSGATKQGIEDIYNAIQMHFAGGEDIQRD